VDAAMKLVTSLKSHRHMEELVAQTWVKLEDDSQNFNDYRLQPEGLGRYQQAEHVERDLKFNELKSLLQSERLACQDFVATEAASRTADLQALTARLDKCSTSHNELAFCHNQLVAAHKALCCSFQRPSETPITTQHTNITFPIIPTKGLMLKSLTTIVLLRNLRHSLHNKGQTVYFSGVTVARVRDLALSMHVKVKISEYSSEVSDI